MFNNYIKTIDIVNKIREKYQDIECVFFDNFLHIYIDTSEIDNDDIIIYISDIVINELNNISICGIEGINELYYRLDKTTNTWCANTEGSNLRELFIHPNVDSTKTICNNM